MRVLQVGKFYHPAVGGIETVVRTLSEGLAKKGIQVTVLSYSTEVNSLDRITVNGVKVIRAPVQLNLLSQPISVSFLKTLTSLSQSYDLFHFHTPNPLVEATVLANGLSSPYVVTYHAHVIKQKLTNLLYEPLLKAFLNNAARILLSSSTLLKEQSVIQVASEKLRVVPFGIPEIPTDQLNTLEKMALSKVTSHGRFCLFVGRLVSYKGLDYLIEAMAMVKVHCPDFKLLIIGMGPLFMGLLHRIQDLGLEKHVQFLGRIESDLELKAYYKACEFFILPSITRAEAFGMVLLEAMRFSKPVITTRISSGVMDINLHEITGLQINPRQTDPLAAAILKLAQDKEYREKLGINARNHVQNHFRVDHMINETLKIYDELLQGGSN